MVIISGSLKITLMIRNFNVSIPPRFLFPRVLNHLFSMVVRIYVNLLGWLLTIFFDVVEAWCNGTVAFWSYCILHIPEIIIIGFLIEFILVYMYPIFKANTVDLVPYIFLFFNIIVLKNSYKALPANFMNQIF